MDEDSSFELCISAQISSRVTKARTEFSNRGSTVLTTPKRETSLLPSKSFVLLLAFHTGLQKHLHCFALELHEGLASGGEQPSLTDERGMRLLS